MNKVINITEKDAKYEEVMSLVGQANEENLIIVARSEKNRKDSVIPPVMILNGIYFYVASDVNDALVYRSNYTSKEVEIAKANTIANARIGGMTDVLFGSGDPIDEWAPDEVMNVLTTKSKENGAGILLCGEYLAEIREKIGDYYILPSSIHEVIIVAKDKSFANIDELAKIVREINVSKVSDGEFLSDEAFEYTDWI